MALIAEEKKRTACQEKRRGGGGAHFWTDGKKKKRTLHFVVGEQSRRESYRKRTALSEDADKGKRGGKIPF